ncbi:zinc finger protein 2 [Platysternon megacephalum]|uniref:Zinc finger protein 2 n=1 Tax=Platysternon megacephalum TaxID=55544 RepID=A0A4D9DR01_9SAUR|nr:zinc finger protein 2 [Platysternon megacephalum]
MEEETQFFSMNIFFPLNYFLFKFCLVYNPLYELGGWYGLQQYGSLSVPKPENVSVQLGPWLVSAPPVTKPQVEGSKRTGPWEELEATRWQKKMRSQPTLP